MVGNYSSLNLANQIQKLGAFDRKLGGNHSIPCCCFDIHQK